MTSLADPPVRRLAESDVAACAALAAEHGWPSTSSTWSLLMRAGEVYGIGDPDDELIGTVALARYGAELSVLSMMIVAKAHARRGHGQRLMNHVLRAARGSRLALYSTAAGRPLYLRLGFRTIGRSISYAGTITQATGLTRQATAADLAGITLADREACGGDRGALLREWFDDGRRLRVVERDGRIAGHAGAWRTAAHTLIGPVVADDLATATALITDLAAEAGGPVRIDVDPAMPGLEAWVIAQGMTPLRPEFPLMTLDGEPLPGARERVFAPAGSALG